MENPFEKIPIDSHEGDIQETKKRLQKTSERLGEAEKELLERHIKNLIVEVASDFKLDNKTLSLLSKDEEIVELSNEIFGLEHQSQTTIEEGGYTNKDKAELLRGQLASLIERKLPEIEKAA